MLRKRAKGKARASHRPGAPMHNPPIRDWKGKRVWIIGASTVGS